VSAEADVGRLGRLWARPWVWALLAILVATTAYAALRYAPLFRVDEITVIGVEQVSAGDVVEATGLAGARPPLLTLSLDDIAAEVEELDAVASARVSRDWPNTLRIVIREREPIGYVVTVSGAVLLVGSDGSMYREVLKPPEHVPQLPAVAVPGEESSRSYPSVAGASAEVAFEVVESLPSSLRRSIEQVSASGPRDVELRRRDGVVIRWGTSADAERKAQVVAVLQQRRGWGTDFTVVDVTAPDAPALSP
jgi:cell division protein FtsQ